RRWAGRGQGGAAAYLRQVCKGPPRPGRWRREHGPGACHRKGDHGGAWRSDPSREPDCERAWRTLHPCLPARGFHPMSSNRRVLLVDDEAAIVRFLRPALEANDFEIISAGTAAEAIKRVAADSPDIVLLDLGLPDGDGKDV